MPENAPAFINRELSWLEFNRRVLEEAQDASVPLLERVKFLGITASNLDEFFMVRVGGLQQLVRAGKRGTDPAGLSAEEQLAEISRRAHAFVGDQYACLLKELDPQLAAAGIRRLSVKELAAPQIKYLEQFFEREVYPVVTPMAVGGVEDFPLLPGLNVSLCVRLAPKPDAELAGARRFAVIALPRRAARFVVLPKSEGYQYVLLEELVTGFLDRLFPGNAVEECAAFRITRNADMSVTEDQAGDLLSQMQEVLNERRESDCVRLEVSQGVSKEMMAFFREALGVGDPDVYEAPGPLDLGSFLRFSVPSAPAALRNEPWPPQLPADLACSESIFEMLSERDVLLFHPYDTFDPVQKLLEQAADDPDVLAIKQILYRTSENSPIVSALARAAERGKHVTAVVELKARFDEARNIERARELERAGVHVIYGIKGLKTHAKVCLVVRREPSGIRRYVHFGTGNYNEITARLYSDVSYMTTLEDYGADASMFFNAITGYSEPPRYRKIEAAPIGLRSQLLEFIENEAQRCQQGQAGRIMAKMNSLADPDIIKALYAASQAGVQVQLSVRGICSLKPEVKGLSDNITVVSVVDRFLEHSRILYFGHGGEPLIYISSADWMPRNIHRRIELLVPVEDPACRARLVAILETGFQDTVKARRLLPDGTYERVRGKSRKGGAVRSQEAFYRAACDAARQDEDKSRNVFVPVGPAAGA